jgi:hypothetical protein
LLLLGRAVRSHVFGNFIGDELVVEQEWRPIG